MAANWICGQTHRAECQFFQTEAPVEPVQEQGQEARHILAAQLVIDTVQAGLQVAQDGAGPEESFVQQAVVVVDDEPLVDSNPAFQGAEGGLPIAANAGVLSQMVARPSFELRTAEPLDHLMLHVYGISLLVPADRQQEQRLVGRATVTYLAGSVAA